MTLADHIRLHLKALENLPGLPRYPKDGLLTHHGIHWTQGLMSGGIWIHGGPCVGFYMDGFRGVSGRVFDYIRAECLKVSPEGIDPWNGQPGQHGISVVLRLPVPIGLSIGIGNYHAQRNVFDQSEEVARRYQTWDKTYQRNLRRLQLSAPKL